MHYCQRKFEKLTRKTCAIRKEYSALGIINLFSETIFIYLFFCFCVKDQIKLS